ncbi:MAG: tetraacyldisaccharide 4'-kinase [Legionella sp.]|nr:MAG: tetraacyldisaccharide 4'-kinase [Legionella sp.]
MRNLWFSTWVEELWYGHNRLRFLLWPISLVFQWVSYLRRKWLEHARHVAPVPIIVVGNVTVGGVGKTPLVIALAQQLSAKGLRVGVVSRGYGAKIRHFPHEVQTEDTAQQVGDEPKLIAMKTHCPVVIAPKRMSAVDYLITQHQVHIIISDDGLQHYAMPRTIEIVVMDGMRGFGSGLCLPAGPLRESPKRLQEVDFIVVNGEQTEHTLYPHHVGVYQMDLRPELPRSLYTGESVAWTALSTPCSAVAGIGHPERFFALLTHLGVAFQPYAFPDHHVFLPKELEQLRKPVVMTEKDAVKCDAFVTESMYCVPVEAKLSDEFWTKIWSRIN